MRGKQRLVLKIVMEPVDILDRGFRELFRRQVVQRGDRHRDPGAVGASAKNFCPAMAAEVMENVLSVNRKLALSLQKLESVRRGSDPPKPAFPANAAVAFEGAFGEIEICLEGYFFAVARAVVGLESHGMILSWVAGTFAANLKL